MTSPPACKSVWSDSRSKTLRINPIITINACKRLTVYIRYTTPVNQQRGPHQSREAWGEILVERKRLARATWSYFLLRLGARWEGDVWWWWWWWWWWRWRWRWRWLLLLPFVIPVSQQFWFSLWCCGWVAVTVCFEAWEPTFELLGNQLLCGKQDELFAESTTNGEPDSTTTTWGSRVG